MVGLGVVVLAFFFPQVLPALPSCADCASENIWVGRAYMQSTSCTCLNHLRTFFFIDKSVTIFTLEKKEEQMAFYSKIITAKKKIKDIIYCLLWIPNISCYVTMQIENTFSSRMILWIQFPHNLLPNPLTPA